MKLLLQREVLTEHATAGRLELDGVFQCYTLEDPVREVPGQPVGQWKIAGKTAIPCGTYRVVLVESPRFDRVLPRLVDVPGFAGVLIHPGNTAEDTEGCILPGSYRDGPNKVLGSRPAFDALFARLKEADVRNEEIFITVSNPRAEGAAG